MPISDTSTAPVSGRRGEKELRRDMCFPVWWTLTPPRTSILATDAGLVMGDIRYRLGASLAVPGSTEPSTVPNVMIRLK
ncbi:hypothetical protein GCM10010246_20150 [Streptomyces cuspidosporus]|uniref:Uncharacterized protein n=1 Tax=Streptomyces cuspidosporus TaxID=66882 RepID=A0ABN3FRI7_9ACTN